MNIMSSKRIRKIQVVFEVDNSVTLKVKFWHLLTNFRYLPYLHSDPLG